MNSQQLTETLTHEAELFDFDSTKDFLLDRQSIITAFENLRKIIFPKYFSCCKSEIEIKNYISELISECHSILEKQIGLLLGDKSKIITDNFFNKLPLIAKTLISDIEATFNNDPAAESKSQIVFTYPGITAITYYRLAHELLLLDVPYIPRIVTEYAHSLTGIDIHPGATIGKSFCIDHGTGIVIGETTIIGDNVKVYQGVTLGALSIKDRESTINKKRHPTIENNVTLYAGCTVLGGETIIGENSVIGGSAFIVKSIPKNTIVSMELPKLKLKSNI